MGMHRGAGFGWYDRPSLENTAILLWETGGCRVGGIRGVIASASLKQGSPARVLGDGDTYPRRYCLGLIEAFEHPGTTGEVRQGYPRRYCLGLIEASRATFFSNALFSYPRRYCLGLIEAGAQAAEQLDSTFVSEALLPRPH